MFGKSSLLHTFSLRITCRCAAVLALSIGLIAVSLNGAEARRRGVATGIGIGIIGGIMAGELAKGQEAEKQEKDRARRKKTTSPKDREKAEAAGAAKAASPAGAKKRPKAADQAQPKELVALEKQVQELHAAGKFDEALPVAERYVAAARKLYGEQHAAYGGALFWLARVQLERGKSDEAEPLARRALGIRETRLGARHPETATSLLQLAEALSRQNKQTEAAPLEQRAVEIREKVLGPKHPDTAQALYYLSYAELGRHSDAEALFKRALAIRDEVLGHDHPDVGAVLGDLARLYKNQKRDADAEPLFRRALAIDEKTLGPEHPNVARGLFELAGLLRNALRLAEAEPLYQRSLTILEKAHGPNHPEVGLSLSSLGMLYLLQGRFIEAEPLLKRDLAITEKIAGPNHPDLAPSLHYLAELYVNQGRTAEAERLHKRAVAIFENALGPEHPFVGSALSGLGRVYHQQGRYADAELLAKRALEIEEKERGAHNPQMFGPLNDLADVYLAQARYSEAESLTWRALTIQEKALGADHPNVLRAYNRLAELYRAQDRNADAEMFYERGDWQKAVDFLQRGTSVTLRRTKRGMGTVGQPIAGKTKTLSEAVRQAIAFAILIKASHRLSGGAPLGAPTVGEVMFVTAQWGQGSEAAASLVQMAVRQSKGDAALATLMRERQDMVGEWQARDKLLIAAVSQPPGKRSDAADQEQRTRIAEIDSRIAEIDNILLKNFPEYAALAGAEPLSIPDVQAQLKANEALILILDTPEWRPLPEEGFIWVVTKTDARWVRIGLGTNALTERVRTLRCGLDETVWEGGVAGDPCFDALGRASYATVVDRQQITFLPFDLELAHVLYKELLGPFEDMIQGKHLLIVPSGPLTSLPFHVLVTEPPRTAVPRQPEGAKDGAWLKPYRDAAWLGLRQPITVLPSVASLKALREHAKASRASKAYLGIGNPLLDGADPQAAEAARARQRCPVPAADRLVVASRGRRSPAGFRKLFRGTQADIEHVRAEAPLPEIAEELCEIGRRLGVPDSEILLGANATEAAIKDLSERGRLAEHRIVHFATHGALADKAKGFAEPGLILTPPPKGTTDPKALERDDGYLTASEVATLKLDADWVVLSACNTAGGQQEGEAAEALSGLAQAFFYAGARTLLVSHWAVASDAAVKLTTGAFEAQKADPAIGRAEAPRLSVRNLIHNGSAIDAHPMMWAPFVVVGEGAR